MSANRQIRAILFDLDDTLLDWGTEMASSWRAYESRCLRRVYSWLARRGPLPPFQRFEEAYYRELVARWRRGKRSLIAPRLQDCLLQALAELGVSGDRCEPQALLTAYGDEPPPGVYPFPDVLPALRELRRRGYRLGLVTNASQPMFLRDGTLRAHGLLEFFPECRLSAADVGYLKPHRAIFERALTLLDTPAAAALFVGDRLLADIHGAQDAGMTAFWRARPGEDPADQNTPLFPITPDATIHSLAELLPWLEERA